MGKFSGNIRWITVHRGRKKIRCAAGAIGSVMLAIGLLNLFSAIYIYRGVQVADSSGATNFKWRPDQWTANMLEGYSWFHMDPNGYNNLDYQKDKAVDILLMGSSHMEAVQVAQADTVASRMNLYLPSMYTYNIGISGHSIYQCIYNLENALNEYSPNKYVVIETDRVVLDMEEMARCMDGSYEAYREGSDAMLIAMVKLYMPAVSALHKSLDDWKNADHVQVTADSGDVAMPTARYFENTDRFLRMVKTASAEHGITPIIVYHPKLELSQDGGLFRNGCEEAYRKVFSRSCQDNGIVFVDLSQDFKNAYEKKHILPHGFSNSFVGAGHLNRAGHDMIAKRLAKVVEEDMGVEFKQH